MTPKEEAKELYSKIYNELDHEFDEADDSSYIAQKISLVCVEKILEILSNTVNALEVHYQNVRREIELL